MRAAVLQQAGAPPEVGDFDEPSPGPGEVTVDVAAAGVNPVDLMLASGAMGPPRVPAVVGREGVGVAADGRRLYFGAAVAPFGSWAQRAPVDSSGTFPVADGVSDELAVTMGIAGLAAWLPLHWHARLAPGERVLVLGATGVVGQIAVQLARLAGAGQVVGAGRDAPALERVSALGADATVALGAGDDGIALRSAAPDGYQVVIDTVYGAPIVSALEATAPGARVVTVGSGAGEVPIPFGALQGRVHIGHGNQFAPLELRRDAYRKLTGHAAAGEIDVEIDRYELERAPDAWRAQASGPHHKLVVIPS